MSVNLNSCPDGLAHRRQGALAGLVLALLLCCAIDTRAARHAYGEDFVRLGQNWAESGPRVKATPVVPSIEERDQYRRELESLQDRHGPYSNTLEEPLAAMGRYHRANGDLEEATRLYRRALHVVRVNDGLYSERQIPILQELLDIYRGSGDLEALDQRYDYYFRLYGNGEPPYSQVRLRAALGYLRWQREALRLGMDGERHHRLLALYRLNEKLLQATAADPAVSLEQYREVVLSQLRNLYLLENRVAPRIDKVGVIATAPSFGGEWEQGDFDKKRLETMQRGALSYGARLMEDLIERTAREGSVVDLAALHLELADWYQWHSSSQANEHYQRVVELLSQADERDTLEQWLGQPVELPDNGVFWQPPLPTGEHRRVVMDVSYDVSDSGRISNLEARVADPEDEGLASRFKRYLKQTRFRPRWAGGAAEAVAGVRRDYEVYD